MSPNSERYANKRRNKPSDVYDLSNKLYNDHRDNQLARTKREAEKEEKELGECTFEPEIHKFDRELFNAHPADTIIKDFLIKRSKSKERAEVIEKMVKKNRMKL